MWVSNFVPDFLHHTWIVSLQPSRRFPCRNLIEQIISEGHSVDQVHGSWQWTCTCTCAFHDYRVEALVLHLFHKCLRGPWGGKWSFLAAHFTKRQQLKTHDSNCYLNDLSASGIWFFFIRKSNFACTALDGKELFFTFSSQNMCPSLTTCYSCHQLISW